MATNPTLSCLPPRFCFTFHLLCCFDLAELVLPRNVSLNDHTHVSQRLRSWNSEAQGITAPHCPSTARTLCVLEHTRF